MRYKLRFNLSFKNADGSHRGNGTITYSGNDFEEAVLKAMDWGIRPNLTKVKKHLTAYIVCNSILVMKSPDGVRRNILWSDYLKSPQGRGFMFYGQILV